MASETTNPLLQPWNTPYELPPFDAIRAEHFEPAFEAAMAQHRAEIDGLAAQTATINFDNTIAAFDRTGRLLSRISAVFYNLGSSATSPELQAVEMRVAGPLSAHGSAVYMNQGLFQRIDAVHRVRDQLGLTPEQIRLTERVHLDFVRAGASLAPEARARYAKVMEELASLTTQFAQNVLHDESTWHLPLSSDADLAGLPAFVRAAARQAAVDRKIDASGIITLSRSLIVPFLTFSERRDLREQAWRAWTSRGEHAGEHDNRGIARDILRLRNEQARLHGYASYADYALTDTMAGTQDAVGRLLQEVWPRALDAVERERQMLREVMVDEGAGNQTLEAWDWRYWAEKVRVARYAVDDAVLKPYFRLENMVEAAFDCASRLFGLQFTQRADLPVYHPDVKAYEVRDTAGELVGIFMQDNFARATKQSGAWMSDLRMQHRNLSGGGVSLPVILNNNNFAKGSPDSPTLLSTDDVRTLFHEFGHGLHGLLSNVTYERLSGTSVLRDFVELPSQIFEHWAEEPIVMQKHARHWQTGEPLPAEQIEKIQRARKFNQGYETVRYCASALVDMAAHALTDAEPPADLCAFEAAELKRLGLPHGVGLNHRLVHFQHLFSGSSYAAGYYVYLWAEVLDADGFDAFVEAGSPFDPTVAAALKRYIYSSGNSLPPAKAFESFRGRAPVVLPMLKQRGLVDEAASA